MTDAELDRASEEYLNKLDRLVAEKVMQFACRDTEPACFYYEPGTPLHKMTGITSMRTICTVGQWQPSRNIAQAWEVLEKLSTTFVYLRKDGTQGTWRIRLNCILEKDEKSQLSSGGTGEEETASLAICLAALRAVGEKV